ncbi:hypothetical protein M878_45195 [Streptomyces roseochromogenus subsp. oscitans DS 12.976]|uniref:Uncharacterized protein n=1 Tax=Streptomyces roseochromogenus subsp. oscitans DS 12.976 TaxID=1352936 RepID=V6JNV7_STRRC|nr:hypothetical protein M878_45195 [Streptomyces roseochromogenus subsp. oscitans DS 12.976]
MSAQATTNDINCRTDTSYWHVDNTATGNTQAHLRVYVTTCWDTDNLGHFTADSKATIAGDGVGGLIDATMTFDQPVATESGVDIRVWDGNAHMRTTPVGLPWPYYDYNFHVHSSVLRGLDNVPNIADTTVSPDTSSNDYTINPTGPE